MKYLSLIILLISFSLCSAQSSKERAAYDAFMNDKSKHYIGELFGGGIVVYETYNEIVSPPNYTFIQHGLIMSLNIAGDSLAHDSLYVKPFIITAYDPDGAMALAIGDLKAISGYRAGGFNDWVLISQDDLRTYKLNEINKINAVLATSGVPLNTSLYEVKTAWNVRQNIDYSNIFRGRAFRKF